MTFQQSGEFGQRVQDEGRLFSAHDSKTDRPPMACDDLPYMINVNAKHYSRVNCARTIRIYIARKHCFVREIPAFCRSPESLPLIRIR